MLRIVQIDGQHPGGRRATQIVLSAPAAHGGIDYAVHEVEAPASRERRHKIHGRRLFFTVGYPQRMKYAIGAHCIDDAFLLIDNGCRRRRINAGGPGCGPHRFDFVLELALPGYASGARVQCHQALPAERVKTRVFVPEAVFTLLTTSGSVSIDAPDSISTGTSLSIWVFHFNSRVPAFFGEIAASARFQPVRSALPPHISQSLAGWL